MGSKSIIRKLLTKPIGRFNLSTHTSVLSIETLFITTDDNRCVDMWTRLLQSPGPARVTASAWTARRGRGRSRRPRTPGSGAGRGRPRRRRGGRGGRTASPGSTWRVTTTRTARSHQAPTSPVSFMNVCEDDTRKLRSSAEPECIAPGD